MIGVKIQDSEQVASCLQARLPGDQKAMTHWQAHIGGITCPTNQQTCWAVALPAPGGALGPSRAAAIGDRVPRKVVPQIPQSTIWIVQVDMDVRVHLMAMQHGLGGIVIVIVIQENKFRGRLRTLSAPSLLYTALTIQVV